MTLITFTFDGGYQETFDFIKSLLPKFSLPSTWFIVTATVGKTLENRKVINWSDLFYLVKNGMEVGSHLHTHPLLKESKFDFLNKLKIKLLKIAKNPKQELKNIKKSIETITKIKMNTDFLIKEAEISKNILEEKLNLKIKSFAYPHGRTNQQLKDALRKMNYKSARGTKDGYNFVNKIDLFDLRSKTWTINTSLKEANQWIDELLKNKGWLIETFHLITDKKNNYFYTTTKDKFINHLSYIKSKGIELKTQGEVVEKILSKI